MNPKITGRNITMTLAPLPSNRRKRKFTVESETAEQSREASEPVAT
jgi:ribosome recycling factor